MSRIENENIQAKSAWETNAAFWDERMGEGNDFFNILLWPAVEKLLRPAPGERLLDIACGNGLTSRRLANAETSVTAFDGSAAMIALARERPGPSNIDYRVIDVTDREALLGLGAGAFDGGLCNMALMDIADIDPLMSALAALLRPNGRFVFSVLHPCFNNPATIQMGELEEDQMAPWSPRYYGQDPTLCHALHAGGRGDGRPASAASLLPSAVKLAFGAGADGLVLDGFEERAFPPENAGGASPFSWNGHFSEIPAALIVRLRRPG